MLQTVRLTSMLVIVHFSTCSLSMCRLNVRIWLVLSRCWCKEVRDEKKAGVSACCF
jgi:hypothetical protein